MSISTSNQRSMTSGYDPVLDDVIEEMANRLQAGEPVDGAAILAKYPDRADSIRRLLPAMEVMAEFGVSASRLAAAGVSPGLSPLSGELGTLGDFRILREVGRGGMGIVYEAEQMSLGRRVALKVLPMAAAMDPRQLQRFQLEARAAACLHHTNIVPVHAVGCERGVHYYAMQFIEGQTLAAIIGELRALDASREGEPPDEPHAKMARTEPRSPGFAQGDLASRLTSGELTPAEPAPPPAAPGKTASGTLTSTATRSRAFFRTVADLGIQAAQAIEHAHGLGVIHRDIKPANMLIDDRGTLWITDFGLARLRNDSGLTMTGDLMGTLRYMSPEQAMGRAVDIDHRTDIYSLAVTLYELVTRKPAIKGQDRQEVLCQIAHEEPIPPRQLEPAIPRELETIVLKAMSKEPVSRYATAQELADDLRRFLEHKPIRARRPSLGERAAKWTRRHPSVLASMLMSLVILVLGLSVSTALIQRQRDEARRQARRADLRSGQARRAVETMYTRFAQKWLANQPRLQPAQREFLVEALQFYQEFAREDGQDAGTLRQVGEALLRVAQIQRDLGELPAAEEAGRSARQIFASLSRGPTAQLEDRRRLAEAEEVGGLLAARLGHVEAEREAHRRALAIRRSLAAERPDDLADRLALAIALYRTHDVRLTDDSVTIMRELLSQDPRRADYRWELSNALAFLGSSLYDRGDLVTSEHHHREALRLREELTQEFPDEYQYRQRFLVSLGDLGRDLYGSGRLREAESIFQRNLAMSQGLSKDFPSFPVSQFNVAVGMCCLGNAIRDQGRLPEAEPYFVQAIAICERAAAQRPDVPMNQTLLAVCRSEYGLLLERSGRYPQALRACREALEALERLASRTIDALENQAERAETSARIAHILATSPDPGLRDSAAAVAMARQASALNPKDAQVWSTLGLACYRAGQWNDAIKALEKSIELKSGGDASDWFLLAMAHWQEGDKERARRWYSKAATWMENNSFRNDDFVRLRDEAAALLGMTVQTRPAAKTEENPLQAAKP